MVGRLLPGRPQGCRGKSIGGCGCSEQRPPCEPRRHSASLWLQPAPGGSVVLPARRLFISAGENHVDAITSANNSGQQHNLALQPPAAETLIEAALAYAGLGLPVLPLHHLDANGTCSCRQPTCIGKHRGKHPHLRSWQQQASTKPDRVSSWWECWPLANIGIATGPDRIVLDVNGLEGQQTLAELERQHGPLPPTAQARTGSGGLHFHFHSAQPIKTRIRFLPGLDVLAEVGFVVAPPSTHYSGNCYVWLRHPAKGLADCPDWLLTILHERQDRNRRPRSILLNSLIPRSAVPEDCLQTGEHFRPGDRCLGPEGEDRLLAQLLQRYPVAGPAQRNHQMVPAVASLLGRGYRVASTLRVMDAWLENQADRMTTDLEEAKKLLRDCVASTLRSESFRRFDEGMHLGLCRQIALSPWLETVLEDLKVAMDEKGRAVGLVSALRQEEGKCFLPSVFLPSSSSSLIHSRELVEQVFIDEGIKANQFIPLWKGKREKAFVASWMVHCLHKILHTAGRGHQGHGRADQDVNAGALPGCSRSQSILPAKGTLHFWSGADRA